MQNYSYEQSQPPREPSRIPRARARDSKQSNGLSKGWGGARNRRDRISTALKQEHSEGMLKAIAVADLKGMPLNRFWTVNYEWAGIDDRDGAAFIGKLLAQCQRYARKNGGVFAAVWVREIGAANGAHVHIAFHLPLGWRLSGALIRRWIKRAGGKYSAKVSDMRPIGGSLTCAATNTFLYWSNMESVANYMIKGSADKVADELGLTHRRYAGRVIGKRWGRTQNLKLVTYSPD